MFIYIYIFEFPNFPLSHCVDAHTMCKYVPNTVYVYCLDFKCGTRG